MQKQVSPFACHIFVCVNDRKGESKSCADGLGMALKDALKSRVEARGLKGRVRVSHTGCMGLCARGPNVLLHPQGIWFSSVGLTDIDDIVAEAERAVAPHKD